MHRLSRCYSSVSAVLRYGALCRDAVPLSFPCQKSRSRSTNQPRELFLGKPSESTAAKSAASVSPPSERFEYGQEVFRLIDLVANSSYGNDKELMVLRELISTAHDALCEVRSLSETQPELLKNAVDLYIQIQADKDNGIITITDTGIGMTRQELVDCFGTIAQSDLAKYILRFLKGCKDAGIHNINFSLCGVRFCSAFAVSEQVVISTKSPKSDKQYVLEGETNASSYTISEETDPEKLIPRGTRLTMYLKRDDKGFTHPERLQKLVERSSQFIKFPIYILQEKRYTRVEFDDPITVVSFGNHRYRPRVPISKGDKNEEMEEEVKREFLKTLDRFLAM